MLLDRIDIDAHGPLNRVELGPFGEHLNVVCGPEGAGKTAIVRFIRDSLVSRDYPLGMLSSSSGRVVWADRNGLVHCRREPDGTPAGRQTTEFESRGASSRDFGSLGGSWLRGVGVSNERGHALQSIELPESIVDGVITDSAVSSVARVVSACVRSGLDSVETYRSLPLQQDSMDGDGYDRDHHNSTSWDAAEDERRNCQHSQQLREQLSQVEAELTQWSGFAADHGALVARRNGLTAQLTQGSTYSMNFSTSAPELGHMDDIDWRQRLTGLDDRARSLLARQSELRRWIADIDADYGHSRAPSSSSAAYRFDRRGDHRHSVDHLGQGAWSDETLRLRLDDLDTQMIRWRRTLLEVRGLRSALISSQAMLVNPGVSPLDASSQRRLRLDGFLHAIDRYDRSRQWDDLHPHAFGPESYQPLGQIDDISHRIESAMRQIEWLLQRYTGADKIQSAWFETTANATTYRSANGLGDSLRAIREDLRQVQQTTGRTDQNASHRAAAELQELRQSEEWLLSAISQLNRHREMILHDFTASHETKFADWTRDSKYDHEVLQRERDFRSNELDRVSAELDACLNEAADVRRRQRSLPVVESQGFNSNFMDSSLVGTLPMGRNGGHGTAGWVDRDALRRELRRIDDQLASASRVQWLRARRRQLAEQLRGVRPLNSGSLTSQSPLADAASRWLIGLSAGRLQQIDWAYNRVRHDGASYRHEQDRSTGVRIDGRDESEASASDRALAVLAVRMAAGDLLARTGRHVPLVIESHGQPIFSALRDYARSGRQVVVLTRDTRLADQLGRAGAATFQLHAERILHSHRPLWRSQYEGENYVGPHSHIYGAHDAQDINAHDASDAPRHDDSRQWATVDVSRSIHRGPVAARRSAPLTHEINRDFDMAWRELYGLYDNPERFSNDNLSHDRTDWARDGVDYRDGYYFSDSYTTHRSENQRSEKTTHLETLVRYDADGRAIDAKSVPARSQRSTPYDKPESPFYLSVDSPIDQAPSIDAVAAARLRGLQVTHINHLMQQDPNRLADALGLATVDAATLRRWQAECRLVCRVPQLRGFDARILVGCGLTTPAELSSTHPVDLLREVESFLATDRGQQLLLSGSSTELSRITSWIAAANSSDPNLQRRRNRRSRESRQPSSYYRGFNSDQYNDDQGDALEERELDQRELDDRDGRRRRRVIRTENQYDPETTSSRNGIGRRNETTRNGSTRRTRSLGRGATNGRDRSTRNRSDRDGAGSGYGNGNGSESGSVGRSRSGRSSSRRSGRSDSRRGDGSGTGEANRGNRRRRRVQRESELPRDVVQYERAERDRSDREQIQRDPAERESHEYQAREPREYTQRERQPREAQERELRFYLQRDSPVVDAPSIGARMAEHLHGIGIHTVDDLLNADPETVAAELDHRRVDAETVLQWQQQSTLVCRVPMLRGHDAQLLVLSEVTTPEELAASNAEELFGIVDPIARSSDGKRVVRGGKLPDLEEVSDWINFAQHHRELQAA